jgi:hypothetical protein
MFASRYTYTLFCVSRFTTMSALAGKAPKTMVLRAAATTATFFVFFIDKKSIFLGKNKLEALPHP